MDDTFINLVFNVIVVAIAVAAIVIAIYWLVV
jgi:hypothetical protein